jgi:hypothetical protein
MPRPVFSWPRFSWPARPLAFAPEWIALAALAAVDAVWAQRIGFHLILTWHDLKMPGLILTLALALRGLGQARAAIAAELLGLWLVMAGVFEVLSYLAMASSGALVDPQLQALDHMLGFNWLAGLHLLLAHPYALKLFNTLYDSVTWQTLYFCILMGLMNRAARMRELFWVVFLCAVITDLSAVWFPALGPFQEFGLTHYGGFLPDMRHLMSRHDLRFALSAMTGVISFPSFHTILALAFAYGFRRAGVISYVMAGINLLLLLGVPFIGGHYLSDMLAGASVFVAVALAVHFAGRWIRAQAPPSWTLTQATGFPV